MEWLTVALLPEVRFEIAASPVHCPSTGAEGFVCAGIPLLKKLRAATRDENPRAQSRLGSRSGGRWPSARASQDGGSNPATPTSATVCAVTNVGGAMGSPILQNRRGNLGVSFSDHGKAVPSLPIRTAFRRPIPPRDRGIVAISRTVGFVSRVTPKMFHKQLHNPSEWPSANVWTASSLTTLKMQFARPPARWRRSHADCKSSTVGMRDNKHVMFLQNFPQRTLGRSLGGPPAFQPATPSHKHGTILFLPPRSTKHTAEHNVWIFT